jgi:ribosomal protein S18 acetylase RimI-like enzyme
MMQPDIYPLTAEDVPFLDEAFYHAIFVPEGTPRPPKSIIEHPDLVCYTQGFGTKKGDMGVIALTNGTRIGAAWVRFMHSYGFVHEDVPELTIALLPDYRGQGIGTHLLEALFDHLRPHFKQISLSVDAGNPARRLYERLGFTFVSEGKDGVIMLLDL